MQNPSILSLSGFFLTFIIDYITNHIKDSDTRRLVTYIICILWGSAINFIEHNGLSGYAGLNMLETTTSLLVTITAVFGSSQLTYKGIPGTDINWENSDTRSDLGLNAKLK